MDILFFLPIPSEINGRIINHTIISFGIPDATIFTALLVGLLGFFATIYTNEKNLKIMKLSVMPDTPQLKGNLEYEILFYRHFEELGVEDELDTFNRIFNLFINNRSNFRLIASKSYEMILFELLMYKAKELDEGLPPKKDVAVRIMRSMGKSIMIYDSINSFPVKNIESFENYWNTTQYDDNYELDIKNDDVKLFIEAINDDEIRIEMLILFENVIKLLKDFIDLLELELNKL